MHDHLGVLAQNLLRSTVTNLPDRIGIRLGRGKNRKEEVDIMAIIHLLSELDTYGRRYAESHGYVYVGSSTDTQNPIRLSRFDGSIPNSIVTGGVENIELDRRTISNSTSNPLEGEFSFSNAYTNSTSSKTIEGVTAGTPISITAFANLTFAQVGLTAQIPFEVAFTNENKNTLDARKDFTDRRTIRIPPHHQATGKYILERASFEKQSVLECVASGNGLLRYNRPLPSGGTSPVTQRVGIAEVLQANDTPGFRILSEQAGAHFTGSGTVSGQLGLQTYIDVTIEPMPGYAGQSQKHRIPVSGRSGLDIPIFDRIGSRQTAEAVRNLMSV